MDKITAVTVVLNWLAVLFYVLATVANTMGMVFQRQRLERAAYWPVALGLALHSAAIVIWWWMVGHGPYMARSEVLSSDAWIMMVVFLLFLRVYPRIRPASIVLFPATFLLLALATFHNPGIRSLPPTFGSVWLVFHIAFYKIALGTLVIALAFSFFLLLGERLPRVIRQKFADREGLDLYAYRFAGFGFIFWGIAMLAGSIWAYKSWGRYWGWDPVETWALITWLLFGLYLHARRFFAVRSLPAAWLYVGCFVVALFSLFYISHMGASIHTEYFK